MLDSMLAGTDMRHGVIPVAWDDINDMSMLNPGIVIGARKTDMEHFRKMQVYEVVPRYLISQTLNKLIDTCWIDTN